MSNFTKGEGAKIVVKFTENLIGDVSGLTPNPISTNTNIRVSHLNRPTQIGQVYTASDTYSTQTASLAFDDSTSTYWETRTAGTQWIQCALLDAKVVKRFRLYSGGTDRIRLYNLQASNNLIDWVELWTGENPNATQWNDYTFVNTVAYKYYRWNITSRWSTNARVYELELYADIPVGNDGAFTITAQEPESIQFPSEELGALVNSTIQIKNVEAYPPIEYYNESFIGGTESQVDISGSLLYLEKDIPSTLYPAVVSSTSGEQATDSTTTTITPMANIQSGDLVLLFFSKDGTGVPTTPNGWTLLKGLSSTTSYLSVFYQIATGSIASFTVTHASEMTTWVMYRIPNGQIPLISTGVSGTSVNPNSDALVSNFYTGTKTLWFTVAGWDANKTVSAYPTGFTDNQVTKNNTSTLGCGIAVASKNSTNTSEDPSNFTISASDEWASFTVATRVPSYYYTSGYYASTPIDLTSLPNNLRINWTVSTPANTSVSIETGVNETIASTPTTWGEQTNGALINNIPIGDLTGKYLWVKYNLVTTNNTTTPEISALWLEQQTPDASKIILNTYELRRFNNVEGNITVSYNAVNGNLQGVGGVVQSFTQVFTPTDLVRVPNPLLDENIKAVLSNYTVSLNPIIDDVIGDGNYPTTDVRFQGTKYNLDNENIKCNITNYTIVLTNIADLNP